jgi:hypothetical protein
MASNHRLMLIMEVPGEKSAEGWRINPPAEILRPTV